MSTTVVSLHLLMPVIISILYLQCSYATKTKISTLFVFGDSTVDPGNNNYIPTMMRGNFPPYGKDFTNHMATGRFSNGRLVTDFIAEFAGLKKNLPPYLNPNLTIQELMTGVSFASSAGGFDPYTSQISGALSQLRQLELFREYKSKLEAAIGKEKTKDLVKKAAYFVSAGTNDFVISYYGPTLVQRTTYPNESDYQQYMWQHIEQFLQGLLDDGAKKIGVAGVPPIGCLPAMITLQSTNPISNRSCIKSLNSISIKYNQMLQNNLKGLQRPGVTIAYYDIYKPIIDMVEQKDKYGFAEVHRGCCGNGLYEAGFMCNANSPLCADASKYIFWDSVHPTEKGYRLVFDFLKSVILETIS